MGGTGGQSDTGGDNDGIDIKNSLIAAQGTGDLTMNGQGGTGLGQYHYGIYIYDGSQITTGSGNITVTGTGGGTLGDTFGDTGVGVATGATIVAGGSGTVSVTGQGGVGGGYGVALFGTESESPQAAITSGEGDVTVIGTGGGNAGDSGHDDGVLVTTGARRSARGPAAA